MKIKLPQIIEKYVDASNRHDVKSILSCFSADAFIRDEGEELRGKEAIEGWIVLATNIHEEASEEDVTDFFTEFGEIQQLHLNLDRRTGYVKVCWIV